MTPLRPYYHRNTATAGSKRARCTSAVNRGGFLPARSARSADTSVAGGRPLSLYTCMCLCLCTCARLYRYMCMLHSIHSPIAKDFANLNALCTPRTPNKAVGAKCVDVSETNVDSKVAKEKKKSGEARALASHQKFDTPPEHQKLMCTRTHARVGRRARSHTHTYRERVSLLDS